MLNEVELILSCDSYAKARLYKQYPIDILLLEHSRSEKSFPLSHGQFLMIQEKIEMPLYYRLTSTPDELETILLDIKYALDRNVLGIVFDDTHVAHMSAIVRFIHSYQKLTILDTTHMKQGVVLNILNSTNIDQVITSGFQSKAINGLSVIQTLEKKYPNIKFIPRGNIQTDEISTILENISSNTMILDQQTEESLDLNIKGILQYSPLAAKSNQLRKEKAHDSTIFD